MAEEQPDWLADVLKEAEKKTDETPALRPPPVSKNENTYLNISEEERKRKDKVIDGLIVIFILLCFFGIIYIIFTS